MFRFIAERYVLSNKIMLSYRTYRKYIDSNSVDRKKKTFLRELRF